MFLFLFHNVSLSAKKEQANVYLLKINNGNTRTICKTGHG